MTSQDHVPDTDRNIIVALYDDPNKAADALERVMKKDYPMDRVSLLGPASSSGDDPIGVYYDTVGKKMKGWGGLGALWGGLWGLLTGAAGVFLLPGAGAVMAAGPVAEALVGASAGAGLGGGIMAGAGATSHIGVAIHRMGVPEEKLEEIQQRIANGEHLLMLITATHEVEAWRGLLDEDSADSVAVYPYVGFRDAIKDRL